MIDVSEKFAVFLPPPPAPRSSINVVDLLNFSGRHKQEESLFEEMLQVSNAVVGIFYDNIGRSFRNSSKIHLDLNQKTGSKLVWIANGFQGAMV